MFMIFFLLQENMAKHKDIFVHLACKKNLVEASLH
jgi:hypothetical protein